MKGFESTKVQCLQFDANGREVILKHIKTPVWDDSAKVFLFVGYRWRWYSHSFSPKLTRLSAERFAYVTWEY